MLSALTGKNNNNFKGLCSKKHIPDKELKYFIYSFNNANSFNNA